MCLSKTSAAEDSVFISCWLTGAIHTLPVFVAKAVLQNTTDSRLFVNCAFNSYGYTQYFYTWPRGCACGEIWQEVAGQWLHLQCGRKGGRLLSKKSYTHQSISVSGLDQFRWELPRPKDAKSTCLSFACMNSADILNEAYEDNTVAREWARRYSHDNKLASEYRRSRYSQTTILRSQHTIRGHPVVCHY